MTYIEFFDKNVHENICASLACPPARVILVGDKMKLLKKHAKRYTDVFADRGHNVEFVCRAINKNNMQDIIESLSYIVENYDDCVFDLTGGEDIYLAAIGIISERYKEKHVQMHKFNIRNGSVIDCDQDGKIISEYSDLKMTVEENIRVYGGDIVYDSVKENGTHIWDMNEEFCSDIIKMWQICKRDVRSWNAQMSTLETADNICEFSKDRLKVSVMMPKLMAKLKERGVKFAFVKGIMNGLYDCGLIREYKCNDEVFSISYKNDQVKRCLTKAGQLLEMFVYTLALDAKDKNGNSVYNDVMTGVSIDWDGEIHTENGKFDIENEIDVMMMQGMIPIFVSCKNGMVDIDELYKLNSVAHAFGGSHAKKVLIATAIDSDSDFGKYFRKRAEELEIRVVYGFADMSDDEIKKTVRNLGC